MRPTIKDIAERAGVSKTTVSFALNAPGRISAETYGRVMAVVNELDYVPNPVARTLTTKRLGALGLLLPQPITEALRNPYTVELVRGIGELCAERELSLTMLPPVRGKIIEAARRAFVDGLITIGVGPNHEVVELLNKRRIPFVTIDGEETEATINVGVDDEAAAFELGQYVLGLGHRSLLILSLAPESIRLSEERFYSVSDRRLAGFARALAEAGLSLGSPGISVAPVESSLEGGDAAVSAILGRFVGASGAVGAMPSAIVAMSDAAALGACRACRRAGLSIPSDVSVAGFDDIPMSANAIPPLTTVYQPGREKGAAAAELVALLLDGGVAEHRRLGTRLVVRSSTAEPRAARSSVSGAPGASGPRPSRGSR